MVRKPLLLATTLVLLVACRDGPTALSPPTDAWDVPGRVHHVADPLLAVRELMRDPVVRPMTIGIIGQVAADRLAVALEPRTEPAEDRDYAGPIRALRAVQTQLAEGRILLETVALRAEATEGNPDDAEELVLLDALALVVDDALHQLLIASDSTGT